MTQNTGNKIKYAAITTTSIYHEGDERSRTSPGHGYPAYTENVESLKLFKDEQEMYNYARKEVSYGRTPRIIQYQEMQVETQVRVLPK